MEKKLIAVSGKDGQLGRELQEISVHFPQYNFVFAGRNELDLASDESVKAFFEENKAHFFINCAAYTAVDKAETEKEPAMKINGDAVGLIAKLCAENGTKFIHISTDYVFNGEGTKPYAPEDATEPVNFYGSTKLAGENAAIANSKDAIIIRTSWVYSEYGNNFVKTMKRLMKEKSELNVVNDQFGSPTYAGDLAEAILAIIEQKAVVPGIFHFSNEGEINWFQFAEAIKEGIDSTCKVNGIPSSQYPTPAKRPHYSVMNKNKIASAYGIDFKHWQISLKECLKKLEA